MKRAAVTGSSGFLGRHLAAGLDQAGYEVYRIDGIHRDAKDFFRYGPSLFPDIDVIIHCAAVGADRQSIDSTPLSLAVNFELDAALFSWAARAQPRRVVYISSSAAYPVVLQQHAAGPLKETLIDLDYPQRPDGIYGWAKLTGERLAALARDAGVPVSVVRPFSGYGEDQGIKFPFGALAARAQRRENPFEVWGSGLQVRDFIHVDDITAAVLVMIRDEIDGPVNLGTGRGVSMLELVQMFCVAAGHERVVLHPTGEHEGVACRVADIARMLQFYTPRVTLEEGIARMLGRHE